MSNKGDIFNLQQLLYQYIDSFEYRSLQSIADACNNLLPCQDKVNRSVWRTLFYPLFYSGVVDFIGKNKYAITEPLILFNKKNYYYINCKPTFDYQITPFVGIVCSYKCDDTLGVEPKEINTYQILKSIPSIKAIVESYPSVSVNDEKFDLYEPSWTGGLAIIKDGSARYFISENNGFHRVPARESNPEASFRIPYCYSQAMNNMTNGCYYSSTQELKMRAFAMPILIYRILLIKSMNNDIFPSNNGEHIIFQNVTLKEFSELNRIFNNSIRYE